MDIFETLVGKEDKLEGQTIALLNFEEPKIKADSKAVSTSPYEERERVPKVELERSYKTDAFIFNAVNVAVQLIMSADHSIEAKDKKVQNFFDDFVENISKTGADMTWWEWLNRVYQDSYTYGAPWTELVWDQTDEHIVDLKILNPREMDFARNDKNQIMLDENEKPVGYIQKLPYGYETEGKGDTAPEGVKISSNQIFLLPKRIAHMPLYTIGSGFIGMGRVEPAYKATIWKLNLLKAGANSASKRGFSPVIAKVGNENIHPTPQMIQNVLDNVKKLDYSKYMALPWYVELTTLDIKAIETYEGFLKYLTAMQSAALGVPIPFVTGLGEETNRATLATQLKVFEVILNSIAKMVAKSIEKYVFRPISEAEGFDEVPKLVWGRITTDVVLPSREPKKEPKEKPEVEEKPEEKKEKNAK